MKYRIAIALLFIPCAILDLLSYPVGIVNWLLTGNCVTPLTQQLLEQYIEYKERTEAKR